ncbi:UbiA family prenyltransferase [Solwaraspora sp. WMMB335]|uniref:UbiA family prenyltransferase n=1 Tax=Solwaraspora sp. WMMB335 TaxID=3404118 RepID=UPI003B93A8E3
MSCRVSGLLRASHPEPAVAVTAVTALLAWGIGHTPIGIVLVSLTVAATQLAVGWTNDWLDTGRDERAGRDDKPIPAGTVSRRAVGLAGLAAAVATPLLAAPTGWPAAGCITAALGSALLYNWPLKATAASVLPYLVSFGALPAFVVLALPGSPAPPGWLVAAGALLGAGGHFANVLPDLAADARTGVRGLPHRMGAAGSQFAAAALLFATTLVLVFGPPGPPSWAGLAAIAGTAAVLPAGWYAARQARRHGRRPVAVFRAVMLVAVIDVALLVTGGRVV